MEQENGIQTLFLNVVRKCYSISDVSNILLWKGKLYWGVRLSVHAVLECQGFLTITDWLATELQQARQYKFALPLQK